MPFFTLIEDVSTSTHHHPNVHYVFSDDDTDLMTHAALRALSPSPPPPLDGQGQAHAHAPGTSSSSVSASLHDGLAQPQERYLVLDLNATGDAVTAAHSLSTDWQVIGVDVTSAPTWDEGTGVPRTAVDDASGGEEMHDLLADFERRMEVLRKVMQR
ncbi:MAG: hypothetical protein M1838_001099 [Thelocarpon superellum]|nr:MAG: hypothetical protein M1838_001099 [Thelocarpon superellum]